ncbi:MAG: hypothetical protein WC544_02095 [Patescibacteria group bacterium]
MPLDQLKPQDKQPATSSTLPSDNKPTAPPKKRHGFRNFLITLVVIIVVIAIGVSVTGVYAVPGLANIFGMNKPKDLGVTYTAQDLATLEKNIPLKITGTPVNYAAASSDKIFSGQISVDTNRTSAELTAWVNRFGGANSPVTDVQVKFIEGGMEISGMVNQYVHAPVYVKVMVTQTSSNSVALDIQQAKLGAVSVPDKYLQQVQDWFQKRINERMADIPGYSIDTLQYHDGYSYFKGTYPAVVAPSTHGWSSLLE